MHFLDNYFINYRLTSAFRWVFALLFFALLSCSEDQVPGDMAPKHNKTISLTEALNSLAYYLENSETPTSKSTEHLRNGSFIVDVLCKDDLTSTKAFSNSVSIPDTLFYLVNFPDESGFAILSATRDVCAPILAVTEKGSIKKQSFIHLCELINEKGIPQKKQSFNVVEDSEAELFVASLVLSTSLSRINGINSDSINEIENVRSSVTYGPFLKTKWQQRSPFNNLCLPNLSGCCTIAVGQIVVSNRVSPSMVFDGQLCTWTDLESVCNYMSPTYLGTSSAQTQAARFINMLRSSNYCNISGSSGSSIGAKRAFNAFGYSNVKRYWGLSNNAKKAILNCLKNGRPVYMDGLDQNLLQAGHCWVIDGYMYIDRPSSPINPFYHINWGWNGTYDGYYYVGCFDVSDRIFTDSQIDSLTYSYTDPSVEDGNYTWDIWIVTYSI